MNAIELLVKDHDKVKKLFEQIEAGPTPAKSKTLFTQIYHELSIHAIIEEQVFYPALAKFPQFSSLLQDAYKEHAEAKQAMGEISNLEAGSAAWKQKVTKLHEAIEHHVKDEEEKLFPQVQQAMDDKQLKTLGAELKEAKTANLDSTLLSQPLYVQNPEMTQASA